MAKKYNKKDEVDAEEFVPESKVVEVTETPVEEVTKEEEVIKEAEEVKEAEVVEEVAVVEVVEEVKPPVTKVEVKSEAKSSDNVSFSKEEVLNSFERAEKRTPRGSQDYLVLQQAKLLEEKQNKEAKTVNKPIVTNKNFKTIDELFEANGITGVRKLDQSKGFKFTYNKTGCRVYKGYDVHPSEFVEKFDIRGKENAEIDGLPFIYDRPYKNVSPVTGVTLPLENVFKLVKNGYILTNCRTKEKITNRKEQYQTYLMNYELITTDKL